MRKKRETTPADDAMAELRSIMKDRPISLRDLARRAGVSDDTAGFIHDPKWNPRVRTLNKLLLEARKIKGPLDVAASQGRGA